MSGCCGCVAALRPRYKRLVDNIFPANPHDGLVKSNMEKLTFYALSSRPEKLDRIGQYFEQRLTADINRHRYEYVFIAMEALDQLLVSCHAHSLNLFVESYLKMVQKLLECTDPDLQITATSSFVKFSNIEEDAPSYHRRYDFFVSKFSSMCHSGDQYDRDTKLKFRRAGLRGIQGVVRKTVSDDLQVNIWEPIHMDKIVPSLLFNMQDTRFNPADVESPRDEDNPAHLAEVVFRDLICRASYGNIRSIILPVLTHLDNHKLWVPTDFAIRCFKVVMFSVQSQHSYLVIQLLLSHLDKHVKDDPEIKTSIITVLFEAVLISAGGSIGPSVLEVFNNLLRHLRISVDNRSSNQALHTAEVRFQDAIVNTIGEFANNLPDYQKIEIMMFVMGKFPQFADEEVGGQMDMQLQMSLLKTLLKVATKYKTVNMSNAFPPEFLHPLLRMSLLEDAGMRITVQAILHTLIDRHGNTEKLKSIELCPDIACLELTVEKCSRQDILFMKKSGIQFYCHILENLQLESNRVDNLEAVYCTMGLLAVEMGCDEIIVDLYRLALDIQTVAVSSALPITHRCALHAMVAAYLNLISQLLSGPAICSYITNIVQVRQTSAPHLLPDFAYNRTNRPQSYPRNETVKEDWLFDQSLLSDHLANMGLDVGRLGTPFTQKPFVGDAKEHNQSISDIGSINIDIESVDGSPIMTKRKFSSSEEITVESLKKMLAEERTEDKEEIERRRREVVKTFQTAPFEEIVARSEAKSNHFHNKLSEILDMVSSTSVKKSSPVDGSASDSSDQVFGMQFPDLFVY
ncbi:protein EFR3 homolog B-like isoform X2 [Pomacea canaliculata]|uniref:protein EFR3 homolog B-like isoform X2 n=1 Tax=Pomacea canaliculata TaxID=400727 RepID=UPI000D73A2F3|nr:protein EFR3 homolog B-like isoform X2 [Pomacea canaliculata]